MILVSYDGSADARAAIDRVAHLMPGAEATVLTVWEPFVDTLARSGAMGMGMGAVGNYGDPVSIDVATQAAALASAAEGAECATAAGLRARPLDKILDSTVANTILSAAADVDADVIAMGTRGRSGVKSFLLGSVSHAVVHHADRAVLVVPSLALAERRREAIHDHESDVVTAGA